MNNTRTAIGRIFELAETQEGRQQLQSALRLCDEVEKGSAAKIAFWIQACTPNLEILRSCIFKFPRFQQR